MISSATFHVISTELVVGSFALAGVCFLIQALQNFNLLNSQKISQSTDNTGHFALGFGLLATPFAIMSGIASSPGSGVSSPLLVNKMFLSMIATGIAVAVLYARFSLGNKVWSSKKSSITHASAGLAASVFMLITASAGGKFTRNESLLDWLSLPFDTVFLMPIWATGLVLVIGIATTTLAVISIRGQSSVQH